MNMKYSIQENPDGTHTLLRYGEPVVYNEGRPNNIEFEFWQKIQELEQELKTLKDSPKFGENQIPVAVLEYHEGGKALWVHNSEGCTVLRIQCTGKVVIDDKCSNICAHSDINVVGDIVLCIPEQK